MKTKFFKKLSLVLVVAMVFSLFVPAAGVFAAAKPALNSKSKYLHLSGNPGPNEFDFNIRNKKKGWEYQWESKDESIAVVNEKGVTTAIAVGKTTVYVVITDKDGEEVDTLKATVTVRDNIKEVTINNPIEKLAVGKDHDYNRDYVTESGSEKKTDSITRWTVEPDTAEIDAKGVFVAKEVGEYTITARSFQSKARHKAWEGDPEKYAEYVLDSDTTKVNVYAEIIGVKQIDKTKFAVEFSADVSDTLTKDNSFVYRIINGKQVATGTEKIKEVKFDGNSAIVELYGNITSKVDYNFVYGDSTGLFTGASYEIADVVGIKFADFTVATDSATGVDVRTKIVGVNKDDVEIVSGSDLAPYLTFEYGGDYANGWLSGNNAYIIKNGYSAVITATYTNFILNDEKNAFETVKYVAQATATGVSTSVTTSSMEFAVKKAAGVQDSNTAWATSGLKLPVGDGGYYLHTRYKENTDPNNWKYSNGVTEFTYESTDVDKLIINGHSVYPVSKGVVTVLVKSGDDVINAFDISIIDARTFVTAVPNLQSVTLGNKDFTDPADNEKREIKIEAKDSLNEGVDVVATSEVVTGPNGYTLPPAISFAYGTGADLGKVTATVTAAKATPGAYNMKVKLTAADFNNATKEFNVVVIVSNAAVDQGAATRWALELDTDNVDVKEIKTDKNVTAKVYGYNKNNARVDVLDASEYDLTVKRGTNTIKTLNTAFTETNIPVAAATGGAFTFVDFDTYVVTAFAEGAGNPTGRGDGVYIDAKSFTVKDSTTRTFGVETLSVKKADGPNVAAAVKKALNFKINDTDKIEDVAGTSMQYEYSIGGALVTNDGTAQALDTGNNLHVSAVKVTTTFGGATVTYTINVGLRITITD